MKIKLSTPVMFAVDSSRTARKPYSSNEMPGETGISMDDLPQKELLCESDEASDVEPDDSPVDCDEAIPTKTKRSKLLQICFY